MIYNPKMLYNTKSGITAWSRFATDHDIEPVPPTARLHNTYLMAYASYCIRRGLSFNTTKAYLYAARNSIDRYRKSTDPTTPDFTTAGTWQKIIAYARLNASMPGKERASFSYWSLVRYLKQREVDNAHDDPVLAAAASLGFHFLLRASEYLDTGSPFARPLTWDDIHLFPAKNGRWRVRLLHRYSKTNQEGKVTEHLRKEDLPDYGLIPILRRYIASIPAERRHGPFLVTAAGRHLNKRTMGEYIKRVVTSTGGDATHMSSHSLRKGGALAIWVATKDVYLVMREGRWKSAESLRVYINPPAEDAEDVPMATADPRLGPLIKRGYTTRTATGRTPPPGTRAAGRPTPHPTH